MSRVAEVLNKAADLIEPPFKWTQGHFARASNNCPIGPLEDNAVCWCVSGAIQKIEGRVSHEAWNAFDAYCRKRGFRHMADFNDTKTQAEVVAALRDAASKATGAPQ